MNTTALSISRLITIAVGVVVGYAGTMTSRACFATDLREADTRHEHRHFSSTYKEARERFVDAVQADGGTLHSSQHPHSGPSGEPLYVDTAYFGSVGSSSALVISSGTHGVEGFAGSAIQTGLLREGIASQLPPDFSLIMIHALNPYGMAHLRRFTEDNVDLNRNFRDHSKPAEANTAYDALARALAPASISFWSEARSWLRLLWFKASAGEKAAQAAISEGQYSHPQGLFYGGRRDAWSNETLRSIVDRHLHRAARVTSIDIHTGLGKPGDAEVILNAPKDSVAYKHAISIWGEGLVKTTVAGESVSPELDGTMKLELARMLPNAKVTAVGLEFGTVPPIQSLKALRAENWLHHHGGAGFVHAAQIKECLLRAFYPDDMAWKSAVWTKGKYVVERALESFATRNDRIVLKGALIP